MSVYIDRCQKCSRPLRRGHRKKLTTLREMITGFSGTGFAIYLCDECTDAAEHALRMWMKGVR